MSAITYRSTKGSALTADEVDGNFRALNEGKLDLNSVNATVRASHNLELDATNNTTMLSGSLDITTDTNINIIANAGDFTADADNFTLGASGSYQAVIATSVEIDAGTSLTINAGTSAEIDAATTVLLNGSTSVVFGTGGAVRYNIDNTGVMTKQNGARIQTVWHSTAVGATTIDVTSYPDGYYGVEISGEIIPVIYKHGVANAACGPIVSGVVGQINQYILKYDGVNTMSGFLRSIVASTGVVTDTAQTIANIYRMD